MTINLGNLSCRLASQLSTAAAPSPSVPVTVDSLIGQFAVEVYTNDTHVKSRHYAEGAAADEAAGDCSTMTLKLSRKLPSRCQRDFH